MFFDSVFQDPESVSKVLWLDEIQQAIDEANVDENRAKQCKHPPPLLHLARPALLLCGFAPEVINFEFLERSEYFSVFSLSCISKQIRH